MGKQTVRLRREEDPSRIVQRRKNVATGVVVEGLRSIEERIEGSLRRMRSGSDCDTLDAFEVGVEASDLFDSKTVHYYQV